jgi:hypothetical protein
MARARSGPHVTIAYANVAVEPQEIHHRVRQARKLSPVRVRAATTRLVELRRDDRAYRYEVIESVPLGAAASRRRAASIV